jgi:hypothetical protein
LLQLLLVLVMDNAPDFDFRTTTDYRGHMLRAVYITVLVLSMAALLLRLGTRAFVVKRLGMDDLVVTLAFISLAAMISMELLRTGLE